MNLEMKGARCEVILVNDEASLSICRSTLSKEVLLAWDCEGVNIGRKGSVELIQLATPAVCFLLDVSLRAHPSILAFAKTILEDESVIKIIHDPSMDADALLNLHDCCVANVHDTQAWHVALKPGGKRPNLNESLKAFGCPTSPMRDHGVYKSNHAFWSTRPMTKQMISWASEDVNLLFALYDKQLFAAQSSAVQHRAKQASEKRLNATRNSLVKMVAIHPTQIGNLIGKRGVNIERLRASTGAEIQNSYPNGTFVVYAKDQAVLEKMMSAVNQYTIPWQY